MGTECPCSHVHISMPSCGRGRGYIDAVQGLVIGRGRERERGRVAERVGMQIVHSRNEAISVAER